MGEPHTFRIHAMGELGVFEGDVFNGVALSGSHEAIRGVAGALLDPVVVIPASSRDELVEALKAARQYLEGGNPLHASGGHRNTDLRDRIDSALSRHGEGKP